MSNPKSKILFNEPPLTVPPSLAVLIGLNETIALQQLHYWLCNKNVGVERDGYKWIFNTMEEWRDGNFPFWSTKTIARTWASLASYGLVVIKQFDQKDRNMRNYYRIDYDKLGLLEEDNLSLSNRTKSQLASPQDVSLLKGNTETTPPEIKEEATPTIKIKTSLLLSKIYLAIDPQSYGTLTISDEMRKKTPVFVLGWLAKTVHDTSRGMNSPIGYLTKRLKGEDEPDQYYVNHFRDYLSDSYLESVDLARYICEDCQPPRQFKKRSEYEQHKVEDHSFEDIDEIDDEADSPALSDESILQKVDGSNLTPMQAWDAVLGQLSVEVPRATYDRLLRDTAPIRWNDFVMRVGVETAGNRDILEDRYTQVAQRLLVGILNADVQVEFVTTGV